MEETSYPTTHYQLQTIPPLLSEDASVALHFVASARHCGRGRWIATPVHSTQRNRSIEGGIITPSLRYQVMRLALYLDSIQLTPNVSGENYSECVVNLNSQFQKLPAEQTKEGRRLGRMRIRECGDLVTAAGHLVPVPAKAARLELALQKRREKESHWPPETPACPRCKVRGYDIHKRSWPSQEMAEHARASLRDPLLVTYECPVQPGFYHLGHAKARTNTA